MGHAKHPLGGKGKLSPRPLGIIPKGLEARTFAPRRRHLRPMEPGASTLGGGTFDLRSPGLRKPHAVFW